jgi:hypothetical protein
VGFEPTTSLPGDGIEVFPRSDATTAPFPSPGKNYKIIYLLNYIDKVVEKIAVEIIAKLYERLELLYNG